MPRSKQQKPDRIRHIGYIYTLCGAGETSGLREDLELARYKKLGVKERFKNEEPYRVCKHCLKVIEMKERR